MKKTLVIAMALTIATLGLANAAPINLDTLPKTRSNDSTRILQQNYLEALQNRYQNMYNRKMMGRDYFNLYNQRDSIRGSQKKAHVVGGIKSELSRIGEMEQDKDRVQPKTPYQVKAVNAKSIFLKRAMDYYVYGGNAGTDAMEAGNINMRDHKVSKTKMLDLMYKHKRDTSDITLTTRDIQKNMVGPKYEGLEKRTANYRTGDFKNHMLSPFTSLKWME